MATTGTGKCGRRCTLLYACTVSVVAHAAGAAAALLIPAGSVDAMPAPIEVSLLSADVTVAPAPPVLRAESPAIPRRSRSARDNFIRPTRAAPIERPLPPVPPAPTTLLGMAPLAPAPSPAGPVQLTAADARGLRVYDEYPDLPGALRQPGAAYAVTAELCVSATGIVARVRFADRPPPSFEPVLRPALLSWRYSPLVRHGIPTPFCHWIQLQYEVEQPSPGS